jgi:hypothetical protein
MIRSLLRAVIRLRMDLLPASRGVPAQAMSSQVAPPSPVVTDSLAYAGGGIGQMRRQADDAPPRVGQHLSDA